MRKPAIAFLVAILSCKSGPETRAPVPPAPAAATTPSASPAATRMAEAPPPGIDLAILDRTVNPCDDFYKFACGKWLEKTPIPADRPQWGRSFSEILERNEVRLREILESVDDHGCACQLVARMLELVGALEWRCRTDSVSGVQPE